jgi:hypothetical protein
VSSLVAVIAGGDHKVMGFLKIDQGNQEKCYDFSLDGSKSYDPDDKKTAFSFSWQCRVLSSNASVHEAKMLRSILNNTRYNGSSCLSTLWEPVVITGISTQLVILNTEMFLQNVQYEFRLEISDQGRASSTTQSILFSEGAPPNGGIECMANCLEKVNVQERYILKYKCKDCYRQDFDAVWSLYEINNGKKKISAIMSNKDASSSWTSTGLAINPNIMKEKMQYEFSLNISYRGNKHISQASFVAETAGRPYGGSGAINAPTGIIGDSFRVTCSDWINEAIPT